MKKKFLEIIDKFYEKNREKNSESEIFRGEEERSLRSEAELNQSRPAFGRCGAVEDNQLVFKSCSNEDLAELIVQHNGVILPARIGQKVWGIFTPCGGCKEYVSDKKCRNCEKAAVHEIEFDWDLVPGWNKDVFATKEEAEVEKERRTVKKITVIICEPGRLPIIDRIENTLEEMQKIVGGPIETVTFAEDACIVCNEEGRLKGLKPCMKLFGVDFVGTCMVAGVKGEEFCSVPGNAYNLLFGRKEV